MVQMLMFDEVERVSNVNGIIEQECAAVPFLHLGPQSAKMISASPIQSGGGRGLLSGRFRSVRIEIGLLLSSLKTVDPAVPPGAMTFSFIGSGSSRTQFVHKRPRVRSRSVSAIQG
jgi:hypothetical protein